MFYFKDPILLLEKCFCVRASHSTLASRYKSGKCVRRRKQFITRWRYLVYRNHSASAMATVNPINDMSADERRQLEAEMGIELIPGTEVMTEYVPLMIFSGWSPLTIVASVGDHHLARSRSRAGHVLIPQPMNDPRDPLNWNPMWKSATIGMAVLYTLIQPATQVAIGPIFPIFIEEWGITFSQCANFAGTTVLTLGFINFVWVPIAENFGRRPVFIASLIIILGANIWHALATSYSSFLGSSVLEGIGGGPVETLFPMIISDIIFLNDRGKYVTLYLATLFSSLMLSPVISAAMAQTVGWRKFYWLNVGLRGALILAAIFLVPETKWRRGDGGRVASILDILPSKIARRFHARRTPDTGTMLPDAGLDTQKEEVQHEFENAQKLEHVSQASGARSLPVEHGDEHIGKGRPSKSQFRLWTRKDAQENLLANLIRDVLITFKIFFFPIVLFASCSFSWSASLFGYVNFGQAQLFSGAPYNFDVLHIGFTNFACFVGTIVGLATAGPFSDWIADRSTRRNGGIREPEMRLPAMIPFVLLAILGEVITAVGAQNQWSWEPIVIVGYFCIGLQVSIRTTICSIPLATSRLKGI